MPSLVEKYGYDEIAAALHERGGLPDPEQAYLTGGIENVDDFSACKITRKEDWVELYAKPYYFGCEAEDRMNATAFGRNNPFGSKLNAIFSSDIGHFERSRCHPRRGTSLDPRRRRIAPSTSHGAAAAAGLPVGPWPDVARFPLIALGAETVMPGFCLRTNCR